MMYVLNILASYRVQRDGIASRVVVQYVGMDPLHPPYFFF